MNPPRSRGAAQAVISAVQGTIRPEDATMNAVVVTRTQTSSVPGGKLVMTKIRANVAAAQMRKTRSLPYLSASRPIGVNVPNVTMPPNKYIK